MSSPNAKGPGAVYLISSSQKATLDTMIGRALAGIPHKPARIAVSYAASGGPHVTQMSAFLQKAFAGAEVMRFTVDGEKPDMPAKQARAIVDSADLIFIGGGDPVHGAHILMDSGADEWLRTANARGTPCMGLSAGAIILCSWWGHWPDDSPIDAPHEGGELVPCVGVVPRMVVDCHAEEDHWSELALVRGMLLDWPDGEHNLPRFLGLPTGSGIIVAPDGTYESVGPEPYRLR
jgi:cyanophycinase-like exopeptidase